METLLAKYNTHKRATLDRVTQIYTREGIAITGSFYASLVEDFYESLESNKSSVSIDPKSYDKKFLDLIERHYEKVLKVGVSDGYMEITPDNKLGLWLNHHLYLPVENAFPTSLATYRESLADKIDKIIGDKKDKALIDVIGFNKDQHLGFLKKTYSHLAEDWLVGKSSIQEVKKALEDTLRKSSSSIERTFRTETTRWFNETRATYFEEETSVTHIQLFAVTDGRTSEICEDRHGYVVPIEDARLKRYMPPFHPNCRTVQRGLIAGFPPHDKLIQKGEAMNAAKFTPLPKGWS